MAGFPAEGELPMSGPTTCWGCLQLMPRPQEAAHICEAAGLTSRCEERHQMEFPGCSWAGTGVKQGVLA